MSPKITIWLNFPLMVWKKNSKIIVPKLKYKLIKSSITNNIALLVINKLINEIKIGKEYRAAQIREED